MNVVIEGLEDRTLFSAAVPDGSFINCQRLQTNATAGEPAPAISFAVHFAGRRVQADDGPVQVTVTGVDGVPHEVFSGSLHHGQVTVRGIREDVAGGYAVVAITAGATSVIEPLNIRSNVASTLQLSAGGGDPLRPLELDVGVEALDRFGNVATRESSMLRIKSVTPTTNSVRFKSEDASGHRLPNLRFLRNGLAVGALFLGGDAEFALQYGGPPASVEVILVDSKRSFAPLIVPTFPVL